MKTPQIPLFYFFAPMPTLQVNLFPSGFSFTISRRITTRWQGSVDVHVKAYACQLCQWILHASWLWKRLWVKAALLNDSLQYTPTQVWLSCWLIFFLMKQCFASSIINSMFLSNAAGRALKNLLDIAPSFWTDLCDAEFIGLGLFGGVNCWICITFLFYSIHVFIYGATRSKN